MSFFSRFFSKSKGTTEKLSFDDLGIVPREEIYFHKDDSSKVYDALIDYALDARDYLITMAEPLIANTIKTDTAKEIAFIRLMQAITFNTEGSIGFAGLFEKKSKEVLEKLERECPDDFKKSDEGLYYNRLHKDFSHLPPLAGIDDICAYLQGEEAALLDKAGITLEFNKYKHLDKGVFVEEDEMPDVSDPNPISIFTYTAKIGDRLVSCIVRSEADDVAVGYFDFTNIDADEYSVKNPFILPDFAKENIVDATVLAYEELSGLPAKQEMFVSEPVSLDANVPEL